MRAVIFSTGEWPGIAPLNERTPAPLLPLMDRPFLQHVIELLVSQKVAQFDMVLSHLPEKIEQFLGDGKRWGCKFTYHLARDPARPYRFLRTIQWPDFAGEPILLGHGDRLPSLSLDKVGTEGGPKPPVLFCDGQDGAAAWTGWAILTVDQMSRVPADVDEAGLAAHLCEAAGENGRHHVGRALAGRTFADILASHQAVLKKEFTGLLLTAKDNDEEPGIWVSRNVVLHPTAQVLAPAYIGENCEIGPGVKVGPNAVVGHDCVLDTHSVVSQSVIYPGSYVGEALELTDVIVDRNRLINARVGGVVTITDNFILGNLAEKHFSKWFLARVSQVCGLLALLLALPLLLLVALFLKLFRNGPVFYPREAVRLPAGDDEMSWRKYTLWSFCFHPGGEGNTGEPPLASFRGFFLRILPALVNIAKGELSFVGVPPRSREEIKRLPRDWQSLYLAGKGGIVTEASVRSGEWPTEDDLYAAEAVYVAEAGGRHDWHLLLGYIGRMFGGSNRQITEEVGG